MESILDSTVVKILGTIFLIFILVGGSLFDHFFSMPVERGTRWFWFKVILVFSAVLALIFWGLLVITGR